MNCLSGGPCHIQKLTKFGCCLRPGETFFIFYGARTWAGKNGSTAPPRNIQKFSKKISGLTKEDEIW